MKLLNCLECHDILSIARTSTDTPRRCGCGKSWGHYNEDGRTASYGGNSRLLGIDSNEYKKSLSVTVTENRFQWWPIQNGVRITKYD